MGNATSMLLGWRENLPWKKVEISDDCWLDVLKFLSCTQLSEKRFVSRQINGVAARNILHLPRVIIEWAIFDENYAELLNKKNSIFAFDAIIPQNKIEQWFEKRGITLESRVQFHSDSTRMSPGAIPIEKAFFGMNSLIDVCILGIAQQHNEVQKSWFDYLLCEDESFESLVFYAQFRTAEKFSWASLEQFLTFLFHPLSYIKVVEMYAVNQKFVDAVKHKFANNFPILGNTINTQNSTNNKPPYIHCETFLLRYKTAMSVHDFRDILTWLEQNVRADSIRISAVCVYINTQHRAAVCGILYNFVFGALKICAKRELRLDLMIKTNLLITLVKKFRTLPQITREVPTIVIESFSSDILEEMELEEMELGPNVIHREVDSQGAEVLYVFENGKNRMRISFCETADYWANGYDCYVQYYAV